MSAMQEMQVVLPSPRKLLTPGVTGILALCVAGFLLFALAPEFAVSVFGLSAGGVLHGRIWQLLTYPFLNGACGLIGNGLVVLFIGSAIEREWRAASFLWLWLIVTVGCGILWVVAGLLTGNSAVGFGAGAGVYGIIATMGVLFRRQRFLLFFTTLEAQHIAIGLIVVGIILSLPRPITLVWVAGALVAYVYVKAGRRQTMRPSIYSGPRRSGGRGQFVDID